MKSLDLKLQCFETLDSTNSYLKEQAKAGAPEGTVVLANAQTAGRGRMGRSFESAPGLGIYMSLLLRPQAAPESVQTLTANTAVAVCRAIEKCTELKPEIKWVNDIILAGRKIGGILCECEAGEKGVEYMVIGIGLNVITRTEDFSPQIKDIAGSIYSQSGKIVERGALIGAILGELSAMYEAWQLDSCAYLSEYKKRCKMLGRSVSYFTAEGECDVLVLDISSDFGLVVQSAEGEIKTLHSGEVTFSKRN